ncbi:MAG: MGMT family protein [Bryobacteraceae bacterium]|nr:MGMT family protein [Bryobacteraceae bacterium]
MTDYTRKVLAAVRCIPRGKVATYGDVAAAAGYPAAVRGVAAALASGGPLPWFRVLAAGGRIALKGASALEQRMRLEAEGVAFRGARVDLKRHRYVFPNVARMVSKYKSISDFRV